MDGIVATKTVVLWQTHVDRANRDELNLATNVRNNRDGSSSHIALQTRKYLKRTRQVGRHSRREPVCTYEVYPGARNVEDHVILYGCLRRDGLEVKARLLLNMSNLQFMRKYRQSSDMHLSIYKDCA